MYRENIVDSFGCLWYTLYMKRRGNMCVQKYIIALLCICGVVVIGFSYGITSAYLRWQAGYSAPYYQCCAPALYILNSSKR